MVVHFDLGVGLEVVGHEHDGDLNVAQLVYLGGGTQAEGRKGEVSGSSRGRGRRGGRRS